MATLSIGGAQTSSRVCPVPAGPIFKGPGPDPSVSHCTFSAPGLRRGRLGTPFLSHLVPSAPRSPPPRPREPGCDPWNGFNNSYFRHRLFRCDGRQKIRRGKISTCSILRFTGLFLKSRRCPLPSPPPPSPLILPRHHLDPNTNSGGLVSGSLVMPRT